MTHQHTVLVLGRTCVKGYMGSFAWASPSSLDRWRCIQKPANMPYQGTFTHCRLTYRAQHSGYVFVIQSRVDEIINGFRVISIALHCCHDTQGRITTDQAREARPRMWLPLFSTPGAHLILSGVQPTALIITSLSLTHCVRR